MKPQLNLELKPRRLLQDSLLATAQAHPERVALVTETNTYRYGELLDAALRFARGLQEVGLARGERVAIQLENGWASAVAIYGTLLAGGVVMVLHPHTKADKLGYILRDSEASVWLTEARLSAWLAGLTDFGSLKGVVVDDSDDSVRGRFPSFSTFVQASSPAPADPGTIPLDLAALIYTSGTTGEPKGVMMSHQSMVFTLGSVLEYLGLRADDRVMSPLAFAFSYGLYQLLMTVEVGAALLAGRASYPAQLAQRVAEEQATVFPGVPTVLGSLLALSRSGLRLPSVHCVTNAAAALPSAFVPELEALFPNARMFSMYGLTECKRVCYLEPHLLAHHPDSVGRAIPGTEVLLLSETGERVPPGEAGILHVRGPHVMMGYWKQPEKSAQMLKVGRYPGEQLLCTGDLFRMDEAGLLYFVSRSDDLIKTGGEKVSPTEIEEVLYSLPGVLEAAVVGVPDAQLGEIVRAYLVLESHATLSRREVKRACLVRLEAIKVPREVLFVRDLPKTASGKVRRQSLRELATR